MSLIAWSNEYSVQVPMFDRQHQELFRLVNELHDAMSQGRSKDVMQRVLQGLMKYTQTHFADEERAMRECGYPEYDQHLAEHEKFTREVQRFADDYAQGRTALSISVIDFLCVWLRNHIASSDKRYSSALGARVN